VGIARLATSVSDFFAILFDARWCPAGSTNTLAGELLRVDANFNRGMLDARLPVSSARGG
jgi:hypothetical protein